MHIILGVALGLAIFVLFWAFSSLIDFARNSWALIRRPYEKNFYYSNLERLLIEGRWKEADRETGRIMLKIMCRTSQGFLRHKDMSRLPIRHLVEISHLWIKYRKLPPKDAPKIYIDGEVLKGSGFAAQLKIYNHLERQNGSHGLCTWYMFSYYIGNRLDNPQLFPLCIGENGYPVWLDCSRNESKYRYEIEDLIRQKLSDPTYSVNNYFRILDRIEFYASDLEDADRFYKDYSFNSRRTMV